MPLTVGDRAPNLNVELPDAQGQPHRMAEALAHGPVVLGIYKSSCQGSKTMFPFLERLAERYGRDGLSVFGVAQDSANIARSFARRYGITFPLLIEGNDYPISSAFDIAATPTVYLIRPDGTIAFETMGFFRDAVNALGDAAAAAVGAPPAPLYTDADFAAGVRPFVPG